MDQLLYASKRYYQPQKVKHKADADIRYHIYVFTFQIIKINRGLTVL